MKWPNPTDYQDAVQNPRLCFSDPELQSGVVATNALGLPRVASGNFASVYEVQTGKKRWAVRCFLRQCVDQQKHYAHVTSHLKGVWLPFLVDFEYQPQGIRLFGQQYPIVKMQWVDGVALHTFVKKKLRRPHDLIKLAAQWRGMVNSLYGSQLAHGDLQHGNVLVTSKGIARLVDYDAMYVPKRELQGTNCAELGHANYQHPQRQASHYDHNLDNFAALVIYVSLRALAVEPELWDKYNTGENLIFSSADFKAPSQSALFNQLRRSQDAEVRALVEQLAKWCCGPIEQLDNLETVLSTSRLTTAPVNIPLQTTMPPISQPTTPTPQPTQVNRWWLNDTAQPHPVKAQPQPPMVSAIPFAVPKQVVTPVSQPPKSGQAKINPVDSAEMVWIPEGEFYRGSNYGYNSEKPQCRIWLDGYWMYKHAVTVAQYQRFCSATGRSMPTKPLWGWQPKHPIMNVSWSDADMYCQWAGVKLPTEAQWEKAARGTDNRIYPWGHTWDASKCRCSSLPKGQTQTPSNVDDYPSGASPYGILNMVGNVYEWCSDWYDARAYQSIPSRNPTGPTSGQSAVVRGGAYNSANITFLRVFSRFCFTNAGQLAATGFRCVMP